MSANIDKMSIVIKNYFSAECDVNTTIRQAYERGFRRGASKCDVLNMRIRELSDEYGKLNEEHVKLNEEYAKLRELISDVHEALCADKEGMFRKLVLTSMEDDMRELGIEVDE